MAKRDLAVGLSKGHATEKRAVTKISRRKGVSAAVLEGPSQRRKFGGTVVCMPRVRGVAVLLRGARRAAATGRRGGAPLDPSAARAPTERLLLSLDVVAAPLP